MPSLGFLKKKRTRESQPDHSATSHPPSPITPAPTSGSLKSESGAYFSHQKQQSTGGSSTSTPSGQARVSSGGTGHSILQHLQHHLHPGGGGSSSNNSNSNPHANHAQAQQPQQAQQEVQPAQDQQQQQQRPSSTAPAAEGASSEAAAAGVTGSSATTTSTTATATAAAGTSATTSPATTAATTPALSGGKDQQQQQQNAQQSLSSATNNLGNPPHQHDGAPSARPSSNSNLDASPFSPASTSASLLGPPISPLPSASPGTDPALLQQQQQAARPAPPHPDAMQTDQPVQAQNQPQTQLQQQQPQQHNDQAQHQQQQSSSSQAGAAAGSQARVTKGKYSLVDFDILRTLGTGSFGRVHLVQSNHNSRYYAIKVLKKAQVVKMKQVEHTNDERRMLSDVKHPFLITLWGTFQDWKNLYMVMDFVEGGELFSLLRKSGVSFRVFDFGLPTLLPADL